MMPAARNTKDQPLAGLFVLRTDQATDIANS